MFDSFPYDEWSDTVTDFWTFGGANSTGTYIMTVLGCILMVASIVGWVDHGEAQARAPGRGAACVRRVRPTPPADKRRRLERRNDGEKQIDFPPLQKEVAWVAPFMIALSLVCTVIVVIILLTDFDGAFIGPWG